MEAKKLKRAMKRIAEAKRAARVIMGNRVVHPVDDPLPYFRKALEYDDTCDTAMWLLAEDHIEQRRLQPATELLERAAALDTANSSVYAILAVIYRGTRQFEKEDAAYRKAKELSPGTELSQDYKNKILDLCGFQY